MTLARDMLESSPVSIELGIDAVAAAIDACMVSRAGSVTRTTFAVRPAPRSTVS